MAGRIPSNEKEWVNGLQEAGFGAGITWHHIEQVGGRAKLGSAYFTGLFGEAPASCRFRTRLGAAAAGARTRESGLWLGRKQEGAALRSQEREWA
jgi:hypothetical protein